PAARACAARRVRQWSPSSTASSAGTIDRSPRCLDSSRGPGRCFEHGVEQVGADIGQRVEDDLPLATRGRQSLLLQRAQMMRDKVLWARADPGEIAHAELTAI